MSSHGAGTSNSEKVLGEISAQLAAAAVRKEHQAEVAAFLQKARTATDEYNMAKWTELVTLWSRQDGEIEQLVNLLVTRENWRHGLDEVCDRYAAIGWLQGRLDGSEPNGPERPSATAHGLHWRRAWQQEQRDLEKRRLAQVRARLAVWEKPAQTLAKILADNEALIKKGFDTINAADPALVFLVFFKLVPMHQLIKPADRTPSAVPLVKQKDCDKYADCMALALRLLGPQPSLIVPSQYSDKVEHVLLALTEASTRLAESEGYLKQTEDSIARMVKQLDEKTRSIEKDATAALQEAAPRP